MRYATYYLLTLLALAGAASGQNPATPATKDSVDFRPVAGFLKLPDGMKLGPCSGVDIDSRGNVYVIQRQSPPVLCFDASGKFLRSWGTSLIGRDSDMQGPCKNASFWRAPAP